MRSIKITPVNLNLSCIHDFPYESIRNVEEYILEKTGIIPTSEFKSIKGAIPTYVPSKRQVLAE